MILWEHLGNSFYPLKDKYEAQEVGGWVVTKVTYTDFGRVSSGLPVVTPYFLFVFLSMLMLLEKTASYTIN